jgi:hypothetical protein
MKQELFGLHQKQYLSEVSVTMKNADICALTIQKARILKRKAIEYEIQFTNEGLNFSVNFKANKKYLTVISTYPLNGVRSCLEHDGSLVKKMRMGYFNDQGLQLTPKGDMMLSFLLNDIINTTLLTKKNPAIVASYYRFIRTKLEENIQLRINETIKYEIIKKSPYASWL